MPNNDELTRADYIRALLGNKNQYVAQGGNMLNPALSNDISGLAALDTSFNGVQPQAQPKQEKTKSGFEQFMDGVLGFVDEIAAKFGAGYVGAWEGILDFGATAIGAIGDATGWYSSQPFTDWAKQDIGTAASEWMKSTFGLGAIKSGIQGNWANRDYWKDVGENLGNVLGSGFFVKNKLPDVRTDLSDKWYGSNDEILQQMNVGDWKAGEFLGGLASSAGGQFAARGLGKAFAGASKAAQGSEAAKLAYQTGNLTHLGLHAAGKGSEQALNEGASAGKALGYGAATGGVEVASEMIVGPILEKMGLGLNTVAGTSRSAATKALSGSAKKELIKNIGKAAFEEGAEEVFSALFEPVTKSIYQGTDAYKDSNGNFIYASAEYWVGKGGDFNESVLGQFASGAVSGGIMTGVSETSLYKKAGKDGYLAVKGYGKFTEGLSEVTKLRKEGDTTSEAYRKACEKCSEGFTEFEEYSKKIKQDGSIKNLKELASLLNNPEELEKVLKSDSKDDVIKFIDSVTEEGKNWTKTAIRNNFNTLKRITNGKVELKFYNGDSKFEGNTIYLNENTIEQDGVKDLVHEYLGHAYAGLLSPAAQKAIFKAIQDDKVNARMIKEVEDDPEYKDYFEEEVVARYLGDTFEQENAGKNIYYQLDNLNQIVGHKTIFDHILDMYNGVKRYKPSDPIFKEYVKSINNFLRANQSNFRAKRILSIAEKLKKDKKLTEAEEKFYKKYKDVIDAVVKAADVLEQTKYSKVLVKAQKENLKSISDELRDFSNEYDDGDSISIDEFKHIINTYFKGKLKVEISQDSYSTSHFYDTILVTDLESGIEFSTSRYQAEVDGGIRNILDAIANQMERAANSNDPLPFYDYSLYSKDTIVGKYTVGSNKKQLEVRKVAKGYEVVYPNDVVLDQEQTQKKGRDVFTGRTITEAVVNGETIKFDTVKNIRAYLDDIKAEKVKYEQRTKQPPLNKPESKDLTDKNMPKEAEMKKADETPVKKKFRIFNGATVYASDDLGTTVDVFKISRKAKGEKYTVDITDGKTAEIKTQELSYKQLRSILSSYTNVSNKKENLQTVQKNRTVQEEKKITPKKEGKKSKSAENVQKSKKSSSEKKVDFDSAAKEVFPALNEKQEKEKRVSTYRNLKTTKDIIDQTIESIEKKLGEGYKVVPPINMKDFTWRTFTDINQVQDVGKEASRLVDKMLETYVYVNESEYVSLGEMLDENEITNLKLAARQIIESADKTKARSASARLLQVQNEQLADMAREFKKGQGRTRVFTRLRDSARNQAGRVFEITGNRIAKDGIYALLDSVKEIHSNGDTFSAKNLRDNIEETLKWYNEDDVIEKYEDLPFRSEIREALIELRDSVGKSIVKANGTVAKNVTTETMQKAIEFIRLVKAEINRMYKNSIDKYLPASVQTIAAMNSSNYGKTRNVISRYVNMYKRGFAPYYAVLEEILGGNSAAARILIYDMQNGTNKKTLYVGTYHDLINKKLKELNLKKNFDSKKLSIRGQEITIDQAMGLYLSTQVDANFKAMDESGVKLYDTKLNKTVEFAKAGEAAALKSEIENLLPEDYKKLANYLLETLNGSIKGEYIDWYENKFGKYNRRNEIGEIGANTYWMLARSYQKATNLSKAVSNPDAVFSHSISRTDTNDNSVLITGALSSFDAYINKLGRELYVKPVYEDAIQTLNAKFKGGKSIAEAINDRNDGSKDFQLLKNAMKEMLEANRREANTLDRMVSAFSVAKLSLNIGSMMKQFASAFTSNIPIRKTAKALIERWSPEARAEFKKLFDGVWDATKKEWTIEPIGGLKYRAANEGVLNANADSAGQLTKKIARVGMLGISKVDMFTVSTGVYSLMVIGQDQFNAKIGTQANIDFVKEHWAEYELSQIGNTALSKNAITTGDSLVRYLFGFLQGANRAALGSQIHKFGLWQRNRKLDKSQLQSDLKQAKADLETAKANYEANEDDEGARKAYVEANAKVLDLDNKLKDYKQYEIAGGKAIPVRMASGLLAQGILIALVNALMKRIKGKKEWDELNVAEEGLALAMAIGVDWIPLVNFAANIMQGYEVTIPAVNLFNQMSEIFKSGKAGNYRTTIRQIALLVGDMTGIPFQTVYSYIYGALKAFDPAIAYEMRSVLYGASLQSATKSMQEYANKGNEKKTTSMVGLIMNKYKTGSSTDEINKELADLYISGNNALPKTAMTQYTDDNGDVVQLTNEQVKQFTDIYSQSTKDVSDLMKLTDYRSSTNEEKAKAIKKIYDAYYALARAKVTGKQPEGKLAQILALTNGNVGLAKYILSLQKIANITQTSKKTRKELVLQYINRLRGYTKAEKTVLMYLAGYSVSGSSENLLISFLVRNGASRKDVKDLL